MNPQYLQNLLGGNAGVQQLVQMGLISPQYLQQLQALSGSPAPVVQSNEVKQVKDTVAYEQGLLLDMFGTFCSEQPETAKEMSTAFTKFARWMQSTVDKSSKLSDKTDKATT